MSYSRRQLYAMGEPFGDSATRMEAGGRVIYGGGGGKSAPAPTTTVTESGPTVSTINRTTVNEIPEYLTNASQDLVARGQALTSRPYEAYTGARVAEFSPDMQTAFDRMRGQQVAGQVGEATGLASLAGQRAMDYGQFQTGVQQYMNPYMQNVVDIERRKAQEAADQQAAILSGQAARQGAFGGSGAALQQRALRRDTAQQLSDIQAQGLDRAYQSAVGQYNQGISSGLAAAGQLGGLGQQQFGQEMGITQGLGTAGDVQRQREQALLDVGYGDYLTAQKYPYEQLAFQQGLVSGVPYSTTQRVTGREVTQPGKQVSQQTATPAAGPSAASQMAGAGLALYGATGESSGGDTGGGTDYGSFSDGAAADAAGGYGGYWAQGGEIKSYAGGGIASLSDAQIDMRQQMPNITELARLSLDAEAQRRAQLRLAAEGAQDAQMGAQQPTVADEEMAMIEQGIGGLPVGDMAFADGGIVGFQEGGTIRLPAGTSSQEAELVRMQNPDQTVIVEGGGQVFRDIAQGVKRGFLYSSDVEAQKARAAAPPAAPVTPAEAGLGSLIMNDERRKRAPGQAAAAEQAAQQAAAPAAPAPMGPGPAQVAKAPASATGGIDALLRAEADRQTAAEAEAAKIQQDALAADRAAQQVDVEEAGKSYSDRESRLKKREEGMKGEKERNINTSLIEAGLAIMAGESPNALLNIARGARQGLAGYEARLSKINESREKLDDDFSRLYELRQAKVDASRKELRELNKQEADLKASGMRNLSNIAGALAGKQIDLQQKDADRAFDVWKVQQENARAAASRGGDKPFNYRDSYADYIKSLAGKTDQLGRPVTPPSFAEYVAQFALPTMGGGTTSTLPKGATVLPR
jgi:hypothetical protein